MVAYGYDALGHLLSEKFTNNSALNLSYSYDALGRKVTRAGPLGTATSNLRGSSESRHLE